MFKRGHCVRTPFLRVHYRRTGRELSRLGLVVTRRMGNAVVRSRIKRRLREVFRRHKAQLPFAMDVVLVAQRQVGSHADYVKGYGYFLEHLGGHDRPAPERRR